jgi:hypothetical protein
MPSCIPATSSSTFLARQRQPAVLARVPTPRGLRLRHLPIADCARYDSLRKTG